MTVHLGVVETIDAIARGSLTARAAVEQRWEAAKRLQPALHAFAVLPDVSPGPGEGSLAGVAVAVKDLIDTADMPTAYGTSVFVGHRPTADAAIVSALRRLGATVLGKTVTTEFAWQQPGPTRNPWNLAHTPGGSSSGSAAAVAAGIVPLALGTQTFGSVIRPAAYCGVVGFKPNFGTLPRAGVKPLSPSLDHVGLFARSVEDIMATLRLLGPSAEVGRSGASRSRPRFAVLPITDASVTHEQKRAYEAAIATLRSARFVVEHIRLSSLFDMAMETAEALVAYEAAQEFGPIVAEYGEAIGLPIRTLVVRGQGIDPSNYSKAAQNQQALRVAHASLMQDFDVLLTIPAAGEAPEGLAWTGDPRFCVPWSVVGAPALTVPIGHGPAGLPLGLQLVGRWGENEALLKAGAITAALFPPLGCAPV